MSKQRRREALGRQQASSKEWKDWLFWMAPILFDASTTNTHIQTHTHSCNFFQKSPTYFDIFFIFLVRSQTSHQSMNNWMTYFPRWMNRKPSRRRLRAMCRRKPKKLLPARHLQLLNR